MIKQRVLRLTLNEYFIFTFVFSLKFLLANRVDPHQARSAAPEMGLCGLHNTQNGFPV